MPHPRRVMRAGLRRRDNPNAEPYNPVTPFQVAVARDRMHGLVNEPGGFTHHDAMAILLARGARIEVVAEAVGSDPDDVQDEVGRDAATDPVIAEAQRLTNLWYRT